MEGGEGHLGRGSSICMKEPVPEGGRMVGVVRNWQQQRVWKGGWEQLILGFVGQLSFAPCSVSKGAQSGLDRLGSHLKA